MSTKALKRRVPCSLWTHLKRAFRYEQNALYASECDQFALGHFSQTFAKENVFVGSGGGGGDGGGLVNVSERYTTYKNTVLEYLCVCANRKEQIVVILLCRSPRSEINARISVAPCE
ncbi:unnamed protein product [Ceratitis capitata]|uniref:(Mediterranean fruit fly) hypothetical protein n=1 Tax=Ceratitis capitata TaxID=7213 RepID=A0A811VI35_CERCA|nr:unnamed protein product [Ceratitis capitata]